MRQYIYISRAAVRFSERDLEALCTRSSDRNAASGVTGLLLYDGSRFIQALEGDAAAVQTIVDRIARDGRHTAIDVMSDRSVTGRQFGEWSMEVKKARAGCCSREFLDAVKEDVAVVDDLDLKAAFIGFAVLSSHSPPGYRCSTPG